MIKATVTLRASSADALDAILSALTQSGKGIAHFSVEHSEEYELSMSDDDTDVELYDEELQRIAEDNGK